jgi:glycosyltransferase involved in cell wall biosynthesis
VLAADGVPPERIRVVAYPVEPPPAAEPEAAADVLFVNRLVASKGVHVLLRALARLDDVSVAIAGDGPERARLEALAAKLGVDARFLGWVDAGRRASLLRGCRVFAFPSLWQEPFGIAGVEALAAGIPVVASAVGGVPSWLDDGRGGLLVPAGDATALGSALRRVLEEPELANSLAVAGPAAAARFSLDAHLNLLVPELEAVA